MRESTWSEESSVSKCRSPRLFRRYRHLREVDDGSLVLNWTFSNFQNRSQCLGISLANCSRIYKQSSSAKLYWSRSISNYYKSIMENKEQPWECSGYWPAWARVRRPVKKRWAGKSRLLPGIFFDEPCCVLDLLYFSMTRRKMKVRPHEGS